MESSATYLELPMKEDYFLKKHRRKKSLLPDDANACYKGKIMAFLDTLGKKLTQTVSKWLRKPKTPQR